MPYILSDSVMSAGSVRSTWKKTVTVDPNGTLSLPDGYVMKWVVPFFENDATIRIGTTMGGDEILADTFIAANSSDPIDIGFCDKAGLKGGTIYFTCDQNGIIDVFRF